jgi:hypothetical protein
MKKNLLYTLLLAIVFTACAESDRKTDSDKPENEEDAARIFIRAALDGDFDKARTLVLKDSLNLEDLDVSERYYKERMSAEEKSQYRGASIHIHEKKNLDSTTSIVYFSNTYRKQKDSLKVIKQDDRWLIDFKYIFKHKPDSLQ